MQNQAQNNAVTCVIQFIDNDNTISDDVQATQSNFGKE